MGWEGSAASVLSVPSRLESLPSVFVFGELTVMLYHSSLYHVLHVFHTIYYDMIFVV